MTLPTTGKISLGDINVELRLARTTPISLGSSIVRALAGKPSGQVKISDLRGKTYTPPTGDAFQIYGFHSSDAPSNTEFCGYDGSTNSSMTPTTYKGYTCISFGVSRSASTYTVQILFSTANAAPMNTITGITIGGMYFSGVTYDAGTSKITLGVVRVFITAEQFNAIRTAIGGKTTTAYLHY